MSVDLKELRKEELGGGITLRQVLPVGGIWEKAPKSRLGSPKPFFIVTLLWRDAPEGFTPFSDEPGGILEARIFPPRPEEGPNGAGWLVTDTPGPAGQQGTFDTYEEALTAVLLDLRTYDSARRLGHHTALP